MVSYMNTGAYILTISLFLGLTIQLQGSKFHANHSKKKLLLVDHAYEDNVKTIQLYPAFGTRESELLPAVTPITKPNLLLEFDVLDNDMETYNARIIHCNSDWSKSDLADLDFMMDYNEFSITEYEYSNATTIPYVHYWFQLPRVKLPGNYVVMVYRGSDREDLLLTKRFMVYDNRVTFSRDGNLIGAGKTADLNQQINFTINYKNIEILNPMVDVIVVIRQNQRWDNLLINLKPTFAREMNKELEYRFFDPDKLFKGGNEFRFFDLRSINYPGRNVATVDKTVQPNVAYIQNEKSRKDEAYSQYDDMNGNFHIDNLDYNDLSACNYITVNFTLTSAVVQGDVYVQGALNYWELNDQNKMTYDADRKEYHASLLLKQGWYDYQYAVKSNSLPPLYFEGSHFQTENMYEIFVYHRPFQPRADLLIGYAKLQMNER